MTDDETRIMQAHGITCEVRQTFHFQGHRYDRLSDAVNYAQLQQRPPVVTPAETRTETVGPDNEQD